MTNAGLYTVDGNRLHLNLHPGQRKIWESDRRFLVILAGTQGGKTSFGPFWFHREIARCGPGDYVIVTPTFPLLDAKALPEFMRLFDTRLQLGRYYRSGRKFIFSEDGSLRTFGPDYKHADNPETRINFGYATDPDSLEAMTAKAAWLDEPGQKKFKVSSWEAILRRLSLNQGRALLTTTIYHRGWIKARLYDKWQAGDKTIEVSSFESRMNPSFPLEEYYRAMNTLPAWKFNMFYRGVYDRPAGQIYDNFDRSVCVIPRFAVPQDWKRFIGLDFGAVNTAAIFFAQEPRTGRLFAYREYLEGGRTSKQHVDSLLAGDNWLYRPVAVGGSKSEGQWRSEFAAGGLGVRPPLITEVEVGIDRVYAMHSKHMIMVFDDLDMYLNEKESYSREVDEDGNPTDAIENKSGFHLMDAERYIIGWLKQQSGEVAI